MRRKVARLAVIVVGLFMLTGCSTLDFWKEDAQGHYYKVRSQLNSMHQFIDRHFFDYNWDDPTLEH